MRKLVVLLGIVLGLYLALLSALFFMQRGLVFAADTTHVLPSQVGLDGVAEIALETEDGHRLYCWHARAKEGKPTVLFFHGNGANVASREGKLRPLVALGYGVFLVGYPGYGGSDGSPSEPAFIEAAHLAYHRLTSLGARPGDIVIYGESMGSAVAVQLAAASPARALVLEAPMSSVLAIAQMRYPYAPVAAVLRDPFLSNEHIRGVRMPLLVVHGEQDEAIPIASGRALFEAANEPKTFHAMPGAGHNNLYDFPIVEVMQSFLDRHPKPD